MNINDLLKIPKTIAIVGLSDKEDRPSYIVAKYLIEYGYSIIPINPTISQVFGIKAYPSIKAIPLNQNIDIVDIFRRSEEVPAIIKEIIETGRKPLIWMQEGVVTESGKIEAEAAGMKVVMDRCIMKSLQDPS